MGLSKTSNKTNILRCGLQLSKFTGFTGRPVTAYEGPISNSNHATDFFKFLDSIQQIATTMVSTCNLTKQAFL